MLKKLKIAAVVFFVLLVGGCPQWFGLGLNLWERHIERPIRRGDHKAILAGCRFLMQNRYFFWDSDLQGDKSSSGDDVVRLSHRTVLHDRNVPAFIREMDFGYCDISSNEVMICLSAIPRVYLLAFPEGDTGYGSKKLIDGLWFSSSPSSDRKSRIDQPQAPSTPKTATAEAATVAKQPALTELIAKADAGDASAQGRLGLVYYWGEMGETVNFVTALKYFTPAADKGDGVALFGMASMTREGYGVVESKEEADKLYARAVAALTKQADQGDSRAMSCLGECYYEGWGVLKDGAKAIELFRKSADLGDYDGQINLGNSYSGGRGPKDTLKAFEWYRKAARQGYAIAKYNLSKCYYDGRGVPKDAIKSFEWLEKAAEQGYAPAQHLLGFHYFGTDKAKSLEWYKKAAEQRYTVPE